MAEAYFKVEAGTWQKFEAVLTPDSTCQKASLQILALDNGDMDIDVVSLMPEDTYKGHGLRKDLAQAPWCMAVVTVSGTPTVGRPPSVRRRRVVS